MKNMGEWNRMPLFPDPDIEHSAHGSSVSAEKRKGLQYLMRKRIRCASLKVTVAPRLDFSDSAANLDPTPHCHEKSQSRQHHAAQ
jgi:hypothetical protein